MSRGVLRGVDARTCKQANLRLFNDGLNRILKDLPNTDLEKFFTVEYKGHEFNVLPFLFNGAIYFDGTSFEWLLNLISKEMPIERDVMLSELDKVPVINRKMFDALLPGERGRRELYALYFAFNPVGCARLLYQSSCRALNKVIIGQEYGHLQYQYKDICNTQAFSYYLSVYWVANMTPALRKQIEPNLRKVGFMEMFDTLCPESSIHFKYISGELSVEQLVQDYTAQSFPDGSSIAERETYSNTCRGNYDGSPLTAAQLSIGHEEYTFLMQCAEQYMNMHLAHAFLYGGAYERMNKEMKLAASREKHNLDEMDKLRTKYTKSADEKNRLRKQNKELQEQVRQLRAEISSHTTDDYLLKRVSELESKLSVSQDENERLFAERLELKQELSSRAKEIKHLTARLREQGDEDVDEGVVTEEVPLETMIDALKIKRIAMVGGDRSKSLVHTFKNWGFTSFKNISGNVRRLDCDFLVICTILCSHTDVSQAERLAKGENTEMVYVNNTNAEIILRALYDSMNP